MALGLIPYVPGRGPADNTIAKQPPADRQSLAKNATPAALDSVYELDVFIVYGPIADTFAKKNPIISRRIEIQGSHTLKDLHQIIFKAFDQFEEHMYEFQIGGSGPNDPKARRYTLKSAPDKKAGEVSQTTIASLGLSIDESFGYWFDFGDDWWHQINVVAISEPMPKVKYPRITEREGASPHSMQIWNSY